ncbi:MAG TPA: TetR/AcrR family transcriptional regulator [Gemmatimonadales bacterium]|nr:TetR/AcrR family transcriptional regulator [Gemmatimonadales bacterium]
MTSSSTRARLLAEARRLFAQAGYDGASVRRITARAGANLGAVTYHFGGKQRLYHEVLAAALAPLAERVVRAAAGPGDPLSRLGAVMRVYFAYLDEQRDLPGLILQTLAPGRSLPPPVRAAFGRILAALTGVIEEGQRVGSIVNGRPLFLTLSLLAQPIYFSLARSGLSKLTDGLTDRPEVAAELVEHALGFARRGLSPAPEVP